jgi:hypothetical protein
MGRAYVWGLRGALRRWPVVGLLFGAHLAAGLCAGMAAWLWLAAALDNSLATRTLLADLDVNVFVDLFVHHGASLRMLVLLGAAILLGAMAIGIWLNAVAVVAVAEEETLGACARRAFDLYASFVGLAAIAYVVAALTAGGTYLAVRLLWRWTAESPSELRFYAAAAVAVAAAVLIIFFLSTVHIHARVHCAATRAGAVSAYAWALRFVGRGEWRALPLSFVLVMTGGAIWVVYQTVAMLVPATSPPGVTVSLLWAQAFVLARMLMRLWSFAAANELQSAGE